MKEKLYGRNNLNYNLKISLYCATRFKQQRLYTTHFYVIRALDLSQCKDGPVLYKEPENQLRELVSGLPYLHWLDIAGTNLAGFLSPIHTSHKPEKQSSDDSDSRYAIKEFVAVYLVYAKT